MVKFAILKSNFFWAWYGRLNLKAITGRAGSWAPGTLDNQWLQVYFQRSTNITGISTQGFQSVCYEIHNFFQGRQKKFHGYKTGAALEVR